MEFQPAVVEKLLITQPFGQVPIKVDKMSLLLNGIVYDRHFGQTRNSDVRSKKLLSKGIETANLRQITIVSTEELAEISQEIGTEALPDDLEANITLSGIEKLTKLPPGTFIKFPRNAIIFVTAENLPCVIPAKNMMRRGVDKMTAVKFSKAAMGKRGVTALVFAAGFIKVGDKAEVYLPQSFE